MRNRLTLLKSKIHNALVTDAVLDYVGSITIDLNLMDACGLFPNEKVLVVNNNNGNRLETYVIKGKRGSGIICLNGAAAHKFSKGDTCIIMSFVSLDEAKAGEHEPICIYPHSNNLQFKTNLEICQDLLTEIIDNVGLINTDDIERISLKMGRTEDEIREIAKTLLNHRES